MKKAMIYGGVISLSLIALGTVFKIFHWPGAGQTLLLGFFVLCFVFFPSALYLNYNSTKKGLGINLAAFVGGTAFMVGILFKVMHWPGTSMILIIGWSILLGLFVPLLLFSKLRENIPGKEKRIYTLGAFSLILFEAATLFKIMHWPGAGPLMIVGSVLLVGLFVPMYTHMHINANKMTAGQFVFVITLSMYTTALTFLLAMNVSGPVLERFVGDNGDNKQIVNYFEKKKQRLLIEMANDSTVNIESKKAVIQEADKVKQIIQSIRIELLCNVECVDKNSAANLILHPEQIIKKDNYNMVNHLLLNGKGETSASSLKNAIDSYRTNIIKLSGNNSELAGKINGLLNTSPEDYEGLEVSWEETNFKNNMLISTLSRLSAIEKNICLTETEVLTLKN